MKFKIAIIGAGLAGLTAAYRLKDHFDVQVFEARERIGGRVFSATIDGRTIELGGQNIADGGDAKCISALLDEFSLKTTQVELSLDPQYFDGETFLDVNALLKERKFDPTVLHSKLKALKKTCKNMEEVLSSLFEKGDPLYKSTAIRLAGYEGTSVDKLSTHYIETLYHILMGGISAAHGVPEEDDPLVEFTYLKEGNSTLIDALTKDLEVHTNCALKELAKVDQGYILKFSNGQTFEANIVVLAIPCSCYDSIHFNGVIPDDKLDKICQVQYGANAKILIPAEKGKKRTLLSQEFISFFDEQSEIVTLYISGKKAVFDEKTIQPIYQEGKAVLEKAYQTAFINQVEVADTRKDYKSSVGYSWPNDPFAKGSYSYVGPGQDFFLEIAEKDGVRLKQLFTPLHDSLYFAGEHTSTELEVMGTMEAACGSGEKVARIIIDQFK